jgi:energy-coupling factor transporter ATP-binding protein EcfA2
MSSTSLGSKLYKSDFHTHTPASSDFRGSASPEEIIRAAEAAGIAILAITDHNTADWIHKIRAASGASTVTIFPGVEITTPEGHILALFEPDYLATKITDLLIRVGIPRGQHGREEAISTMHAEDVIREIVAARGLAIAAHANENNGILKAKGQYKLTLVPMLELAALELTKEDEIGRFCAGTVSQDYKPKARVQGSDSHALSEVGRRTTYLKMQEVSLRGVRQALLDYPIKVRFAWNYREATHPRIVGLAVDQGFFGGQHFEFHENLNCLIGGKGSGKSTVVELLRYCFGDVSGSELIQEDHRGKIATLVGDGGSVSVEYVDEDGEVKTIRREVQGWETEREVRDSSGNPIDLLGVPAFFSQGELVQIASSPIAQMDLIDRQIDISGEDAEETALIGSLRKNAIEFVRLQGRSNTLKGEVDHPETGKAATEGHAKALEAKLTDPVLKQFPLWEAERRHLEALEKGLDTIPDQLTSAVEELDLEGVRVALPKGSPNASKLTALADIAAVVEAAGRKAAEDFRKVVDVVRKQLTGVKNEIEPLFQEKKTAHQALLASLGESDEKKIQARYRTLTKRLETLLQNEKELSRTDERLTQAWSERKTLLDQLDAVRDRRWRERDEKAKEYESKLEGVVRVSVIANGDRQEYEKKIRALQRRGYLKDAEIRQVAARITPRALLEYIFDNNASHIAAESGVTLEVAERLIEGCSDKELEDLLTLEIVPLNDKPEVAYVVEPDRTKPLRELSTGQKGTVILALAMVEGRGPLVIDQPEEPLDTQSIYGQVVQTLRKNKEDRQFIFTTHNANVAVGADAELSHILEATADKGAVKARGGIDHQETNQLLLLHLEGGSDALKLRVRKYELEN